jgi:hypothetical protein
MSDTVTYGHPTPAGPDILTINQAGYLADLIRGVERGKRMRWYPLGAGSVDHPLTVTLRAFTNPDGSLYPYAARTSVTRTYGRRACLSTGIRCATS